MKKIFLILALFLSFSAIAQEWQFEGTKYPNATNQGDTVSLQTHIPMLDSEGLLNYYLPVEDLLALNPIPPTPTLQEVTDAGPTTTNHITTSNGFTARRSDGEFTNTLSPNGLVFEQANSSARTFMNYSSFNFQNSVGGATRIKGIDNTRGIELSTSLTNNTAGTISTKLRVNYGNNDDGQGGSPEDIVAVEVMGRTKGAAAQGDNEYITLEQMQDSIASATPPAPEWGNITGNIEDQTDLQAKFDALPIPGVMEITEGGNTGYVTLFRQKYPNLFGDIGDKAIDLSASIGPSDTKGATGTSSAAIGGLNITASGTYSVVIGGNSSEASGLRSSVISANNSQSSASESVVIGGYGNVSSGNYSLTSGRENYGRSFAEVSIGVKGTDYTPYSTTNVSGLDRVFNVGNATSSTSTTRSDAFTILKNGQTGIGIDNFESNTTGELLQVNGLVKSDVTTSQIDGGSAKTVVTKEWVLANSGGSDLQSVTDNGNNTNKDIVLDGYNSSYLALGRKIGTNLAITWSSGGQIIFNESTSSLGLYNASTSGVSSLGVSMPEVSGSSEDVAMSFKKNIEIDQDGAGIFIHSPDGTRFKITVDNSGNLVTSPAP